MPVRGEGGSSTGGSSPAPPPGNSGGNTGGGGWTPPSGGGNSGSGGSKSSGSSSSSNPPSGSVLWGNTGRYEGSRWYSTPIYRSKTAAKAYFMNMSAAEKAILTRTWNTFGGKGGNFRSIKSLWNAAVDAAAGAGVTPWQALTEGVMSQGGYAGTTGNPDGYNGPGGGGPSGGGGGGGGGGPRDFTQTSIQRAVTDPETARAVYNSVFLQELGREATAQEQKAFLTALNKMEKDSPARTVTRTHVNGDGSVSTSDSTQSGGVTNEAKLQMAQDRIQSDKDWGEYTGATRFFNAFVKGVASTV